MSELLVVLLSLPAMFMVLNMFLMKHTLFNCMYMYMYM